MEEGNTYEVAGTTWSTTSVAAPVSAEAQLSARLSKVATVTARANLEGRGTERLVFPKHFFKQEYKKSTR